MGGVSRRGVGSSLWARAAARLAATGGTAGDSATTARVWRAYAAMTAALLVLYALVPRLHAATAILMGLAALGALAYGILRYRPRRWVGWVLLGAAMAALAVALVGTAVAPPRPDLTDYPAVSDLVYLSVYPLLAIGLLWLGRPRAPSRDWPMLLDILALTLAGSAVVWIVLIRPAVEAHELSSTGEFVACASGVGFVAVLAASARVLLSWRVNATLTLLGVAVAGFLIADFDYAAALVWGHFGDGSRVGLGSVVFIGLTGAAALTPSMVRVDSEARSRNQLSAGRLTLLAAALLIGPTALLVEATAGTVTTGVAIAVVSAAVGVILLARLALAARALRQRATRERILTSTSRSLMVAADEDDVLDALQSALSQLLSPPGPGGVRLSTVDTDGTPLSTLRVLGARGELTVPVPDGSVVFFGPVEQMIELMPMLEALADQGGLALTRVKLEAQVRVDDRERYFRSLVLTSRDVTLISRAGRIEYATPSARPLFGYEVQGRQFDTVVRRGAVGRTGAGVAWSSFEEGAEGHVDRADGIVLDVEVHRRDLSDDPTVRGIVTTLRDVTAERELRRELAHRASHDGLTGLANAEMFRDELRLQRDTALANTLGAVLFVDLDDFKTVNDTHGHEVGDGLLMMVARRIRSVLRTGDLAARLGGDEFAVLLRDIPDVSSARSAAQRLADRLAQPATVAGVALDGGASIGLAIAARPAEYDSLMRHADTALYSAKAEGKGHWQQYKHGMMSAVRRRADLRADLETAIREEALTLHYQPVVDLATGAPIGFEALLRARVPGSGTPSTPDANIPASASHLVQLAEDHGLIVELGDWVIGQALADAVRLNAHEATRSIFVGINVSAAQLRQPGFVDAVRDRVEAAGIDPRLIVIEITESLLVREDERAWSYLSDLREDGIRIAIDDYGTGYASLSYLRQPGIDIVKIDRSFVQDTGAPRARLLLEAVITLTGRLGLTQVAEGIEDDDARAQLLDLGCRYGQGFLFAEAMPIHEAVAWARQHL